MIEININVELGPKTVQLIGALLGGTPKKETSPKEEAPIAAETILDQDMPDFDAPAPEEKEITDADLRQIVKETKDRVGAKPIRDIFAEMGFSSSVECPAERRSELVERLKNLK